MGAINGLQEELFHGVSNGGKMERRSRKSG